MFLYKQTKLCIASYIAFIFWGEGEVDDKLSFYFFNWSTVDLYNVLVSGVQRYDSVLL